MGQSQDNSYDHPSLMQFLEEPAALGKLANMAASISPPEDQDYVAEQINRRLSHSGLKQIDSMISEYMGAENTMAEVAGYVLENVSIEAVNLDDTTADFQEMVARLERLSEQGQSDMAKAIMFYAVGLAHYEWQDRQRESVLYNTDEHGEIVLASPTDPEVV